MFKDIPLRLYSDEEFNAESEASRSSSRSAFELTTDSEAELTPSRTPRSSPVKNAITPRPPRSPRNHNHYASLARSPSHQSPLHSRYGSAQASESTKPDQSALGELRSKKSLPDVRSGYDEPQAEPRRLVRKISKNNLSTTPQIPIRSPFRAEPSARPNGSQLSASMSERHRYFRRISTLQGLSTQTSTPSESIQFADAARSLLFTAGQIHAAIQQCASICSSAQLSANLSGTLNSIGQTTDGLINALDTFDSAAVRSAPNRRMVRALVTACKSCAETSIATLKRFHADLFLSEDRSNLDGRYLRILTITLYSSVAEIHKCWSTMCPVLSYIFNIIDLEQDEDVVIKPRGSISEADDEAVSEPRRARRNAGSFNSEDIKKGAYLSPRPNMHIGKSSPLAAAYSSPQEISPASSDEFKFTNDSYEDLRSMTSSDSMLSIRKAQEDLDAGSTPEDATFDDSQYRKTKQIPLTKAQSHTSGTPRSALFSPPLGSSSLTKDPRAFDESAGFEAIDSILPMTTGIFALLSEDMKKAHEAWAQSPPARLQEVKMTFGRAKDLCTKLKYRRSQVPGRNADLHTLRENIDRLVQTLIHLAKCVAAAESEFDFSSSINSGIKHLASSAAAIWCPLSIEENSSISPVADFSHNDRIPASAKGIAVRHQEHAVNPIPRSLAEVPFRLPNSRSQGSNIVGGLASKGYSSNSGYGLSKPRIAEFSNESEIRQSSSSQPNLRAKAAYPNQS